MVLQSFFANAPDFLQQWVDSIPEQLQVPAVVGGLLIVPVVAWWILTRSTTVDPKIQVIYGDGRVHLPIALPSRLPILGNLLDILKHKEHRHDWFTTLCEKYQGRSFQFTMLGRPAATLVYTVKGVEDCLKTHFDQIPKGSVQREVFRDLLGHGIFAVDDAPWVHQRKTASNLFSQRALRDTMTESMRRYAAVLQKILQNHEQEGSTIDVFKLMNKFTIEAFAKMGFGVDINCLEAEQDHPFQDAFDSAQRVLVGRFQRPQWFWKLQRVLNLGNEARLKKDIAVIDTTVMEIIAQSLARRAQPQSGGQGKPESAASGDIVSLFLDRFDAGEEFDPTYLRDIVVNFLIAGRDTTAQAMSWCFYNLSKHPEIANKIREELVSVCPSFANGQDTTPPTMEQVQQLTYLDAVLKETLRLHPSVPLIPKAVTQDTVLSDGTLLKKGTLVCFPVYAMGRMEFIWGPDAKEFKPERWIDPVTGKMIQVSPFQFVSFNAGPRMCLGMNLAMLEMKIVVASVLSRFNIELLDSDTVTYDNSLTLPVRGAMLARVTRARCG